MKKKLGYVRGDGKEIEEGVGLLGDTHKKRKGKRKKEKARLEEESAD